ncbi:MAG: amino acid transporter [Bacteroidota bacterium]
MLEALDALKDSGITATVDGGWGVDALIGEETRPHSDLDLVIPLTQTIDAIPALAPLGYTLAEDFRPVRFVVRTETGLQIDFHPITFDADGSGVQALPNDDSFRYPPNCFVLGKVGGSTVRCIDVHTQILAHLGYKPTRKDEQDVLLLCKHFRLPLPPTYRSSKGTDTI